MAHDDEPSYERYDVRLPLERYDKNAGSKQFGSHKQYDRKDYTVLEEDNRRKDREILSLKREYEEKMRQLEE